MDLFTKVAHKLHFTAISDYLRTESRAKSKLIILLKLRKLHRWILQSFVKSYPYLPPPSPRIGLGRGMGGLTLTLPIRSSERIAWHTVFCGEIWTGTPGPFMSIQGCTTEEVSVKWLKLKPHTLAMTVFLLLLFINKKRKWMNQFTAEMVNFYIPRRWMRSSNRQQLSFVF